MKRSQTKLEETLNLPSLEDAIKAVEDLAPKKSEEELEEEQLREAETTLEELQEDEPESAATFSQALSKSKELEDKLADKQGLNNHDKEMDDISKMATESFQDLMDLGMNVTPAHAGSIFQSASTLLNTALTAKNNKSDKKLKMWRLQIEQARLLRDLERENQHELIDGSISENGEVMQFDRNRLLEQLRQKEIDDEEKS